MPGRRFGLVSDAALTDLVEQLGDVVQTDAVSLENYRFDWCPGPHRGHPARGGPSAECRPRSRPTMRWAAEHRRAGGAARGGQRAVGRIVRRGRRDRAEPGADAGVEIDVATRVAVVEPGAFNAEVKAAAAEHGLWYPRTPPRTRSARSAATSPPTRAACAA